MGIQHTITTSSAHFVERFNRTFKYTISQKVKDMKTRKRLTTKTTPIDTTKMQWRELAPSVLAVCNNKNKHRITGLTPRGSEEAEQRNRRQNFYGNCSDEREKISTFSGGRYFKYTEEKEAGGRQGVDE